MSVGVVGWSFHPRWAGQAWLGWGLCPWGTYGPDINLVKICMRTFISVSNVYISFMLIVDCIVLHNPPGVLTINKT